ncbi:hypothetical protein FNYG_08251 [Fusarium nygamai]|uniref:Uncharacterized protein n=1 Tax=Gibberella nygamai TaxID=42673 RepID=A0A2K0W7P8_GIBNY|nr:hypothetical protein FNYG_08251 [Fusarium nygamai]
MIFQYPFDLPEEAKAVGGPARVALDGGLLLRMTPWWQWIESFNTDWVGK